MVRLIDKQLANIFKAMVMLYLEYSFFVFSSVPDKQVTKLRRLQSRGRRACLLAERRTPISRLHQESKMLYIKLKIKLNIL